MQWRALKTVKTIKQKKKNAAKSVCCTIAMPLNGPCLCWGQYGWLDAPYCPNLHLDKILCPDLNFYTTQHSRRNPSLYLRYTLHQIQNPKGEKEYYNYNNLRSLWKNLVARMCLVQEKARQGLTKPMFLLLYYLYLYQTCTISCTCKRKPFLFTTPIAILD